MAWTTSKTNWSYTYIDGNYSGDFFDYHDYNRIKNNLLYLANKFSISVSVLSSEDKGAADIMYNDEWNAVEDAVYRMDQKKGNKDFVKKTYYANGLFPDANELNKVENKMLELYNL